MANKAPSALLTLLAGGFGERFLGALLQAGAFEGESARLGRHGHAHGALAHRGTGPHRASPQPRLSALHVETVGDGPLRIVLGDTRVDTIRLQGGLERVDTVGDLILGILQLLLGYVVEFLSLFEVELQLFALTVALPLLVLLPVLDTLLVPFLHETCVALEFVDLDTAHLLLAHGGDLLVFVVEASGLASLTVLFILELVEVRLHIQLLLGLIKRVYPLLEELVLDPVVLLLRVSDFLGGLVITELARLGQHGDVSRGVDLL